MTKFILSMIFFASCNAGWMTPPETFTHDNHKFIYFSNYGTSQTMFIIHHPDCPCQKKVEDARLK